MDSYETTNGELTRQIITGYGWTETEMTWELDKMHVSLKWFRLHFDQSDQLCCAKICDWKKYQNEAACVNAAQVSPWHH